MKDLDRRIKTAFDALAREIPVPEFHLNVRDALPDIQPKKKAAISQIQRYCIMCGHFFDGRHGVC
jgi:hypothetical protein